MANPLCIYHGNCADGFTAAWIVRLYFKRHRQEVDFHAGVYQDPPPNVTGRDVILVDFSYSKEVMLALAGSARTVLVLDHHATAIDALSDISLPATTSARDWPIGEIARVFDLQRSGAGITWDFFFPTEPRPALVEHVEDRDLWRFALPHTREIQAAIFSYPYEFPVWDSLSASFLKVGASWLIDQGAAIERKHHKDIAELAKVVTIPMRIGGHVVPVANVPYTMTSDMGYLLCGDHGEHPFAGCYWDTPAGRVFSLRSREAGADVGQIAKQYGGGGHAHASGFRIPHDQLAQFRVSQT